MQDNTVSCQQLFHKVSIINSVMHEAKAPYFMMPCLSFHPSCLEHLCSELVVKGLIGVLFAEDQFHHKYNVRFLNLRGMAIVFMYCQPKWPQTVVQQSTRFAYPATELPLGSYCRIRKRQLSYCQLLCYHKLIS